MCTRKQVNVEQYPYGNTQLRQSSLCPTIAWLTLVAYIGQPLIVTAQVIAEQAAAPDKRPVIDTTANGLALVQITSPSAAGVSHNQYTQFNIDPAGLILNNSQSTVLTQQAGYVSTNQNLANGAARIILNEVTSTSRSQLNGYIEVAGRQAEVIVANPNGISCNGCGFINTSRGMLTTGTPVIGASGNLDALRVTGGDIQIGTAGLNGSNLSQLDLIARSVAVNGQLWTGNLNVITGANLVNYSNLGVQLIQGTGSKPTVGIDVALLGGMYANKIRLVGTEAGVGVNSLGNLSAQAGDFSLDNQGQITLSGNLTASGNLTVSSNTGITNSGTLYSQQAAQLTITSDLAGVSGQPSRLASSSTSIGSIINTGLLSARSSLTLNAAGLDSTGALGAGIDANGNATQTGNLNITTQSQAVATGTNVSGGGMDITAADINLANSNTKAWSGINLNAIAGNIDLASSKTQSLVGNVLLNATGTVNNSSGILLGAQVISNAYSFNNTGGSLGAYSNISLTANSIDNTNGQIGNTLNGTGNIALTAINNLTNTGGQIGSNQDLLIAANTIIGNGQAIAGRDASISLQGNYTNAAGNVLKANHNLTFSTTGNLINQANLEAINTLSVNAANIDNQTGALINANLSKLTTLGDITNAGYIGGNAVETHSNNFTNTATVMGGTLNLYANNLNNSGDYALIAATSTINLVIANALNNQSDVLDPQVSGQARPTVATIFSLGDINIGSNLAIDPATGYLTGNSASVTNQSATIAAWGNLRISADTIANKRTVLAIATNSWTGTPVVGTPGYNGVGGSPGYTPAFTQEFMAPSTTLEGLIQVGGNAGGGNAWLKANSINNDYSTVAIAGIERFSATLNQTSRNLNRVETQNKQQNNYVLQATGSYWTICGSWVPYPCQQTSYGWVNYPTSSTTTITTPVGAVNATHTATVIKGSGNGVNNQTVSAGAVGGTAATLGATLGSSQGNVTAVNGSNTVNVPTGGLYTLHTQPNQTYLVATDPRFTSYQNFVSSDYMLSRLSLDPQLIQKRLGDGFYEQQLVLDQISAQTGRRFLGQYASANEQYMALLDAGAGAAKELKLVPGVTLTAGQVNALTSDIVWLVDQVAVLPDGTSQHVLVPKVYLTRLQEANLKPGGALIAADVIDLAVTGGSKPDLAQANVNSNGVFNNSGTIRANSALSINANDIINRGGTISSGGSASLQAGNDIVNQSGNINGQSVVLAAGRDIISERLTDPVVMGGLNMAPSIARGFVSSPTGLGSFTTTLINGATGITSTDSLNISAGRDVTFAGSNISADSNAAINAGRNLTVSTVTAQETTGNGVVNTNRTEQLAGSIKTGGNLSLVSGNDMHLTSVAVDTGKDATFLAGGDLTLDASKNVSSLNIDTSTTKVRRYDETVIGSRLNAGGNVTLVAVQSKTDSNSSANRSTITPRTDSKGNITLESAAVTGKAGNLTVAADANVNLGVTEEKRDAFTQTSTQSTGLFTTTKRTVSNESWRTDTIGSSLSGDNISITSGKDINVVGSNINAMHDINVAAMNDVNVSAATGTYGSVYYSHETTTGLQFGSGGNPYSITDSGSDITTRARTDGTNQSFNRSSIINNSDPTSTDSGQAPTISGQAKLNILAGNNLVASGTDLAANAGDLALTAGGTVALLAGQDTLNQSSSTVIVTNPNFFTKQRHTITDTYASLDYQGSTVQGNSIKVSSGADTVLQAAQVTSGGGGINLDAGGDLKLLAAVNTTTSTHTETLSTDGTAFKADGTADYGATRRMNNTGQGQTQANRVTTLTSAGDITTHSGGDTLIEAGKLNAQGAINLSATGYAATTNADGSQNPGLDGVITFAAVKDSTYTSVADSNNSLAWQNSSGGGDYVETLKLANISAGPSTGFRTGGGLSMNANGGIVVDIPDVPATPAPAPKRDANGKLIPVVPLTPEQQTAQRQADFDQAIQNLSSQSGQAWIGQLAQMSKEKPDSVKFQQVSAAAQHWDYSHDGLTPEAAAVIVIVVTYFSAGTAGSAAGTMTGAAAGTTTVASAAVAAGLTTLASEASVSLINNKGDLGKTLNDMGKSENVRNVIAAMITAVVIQDYLKTYNLKSFAAKTLTGCATGDMTGSGCQKGATTAAIMAGSTWANNAMRTSMIKDSETFTGVTDTNDPSGKIYSNNTGGGSAGIDGSSDRVAGTRISFKELDKLGTMAAVTPGDPKTLWTFTGTTINPDTGKVYTLPEALATQGGLTGGTQALLPTFLGMSVTPNSFLDKLQESFAGPHDYLGGHIEGGYDNLGNWKLDSDTADNIRGFMAGVNIPLAMPLVIPTLLQQINFDPVAMSNTVRNETTH